jgi:hypothetical protein
MYKSGENIHYKLFLNLPKYKTTKFNNNLMEQNNHKRLNISKHGICSWHSQCKRCRTVIKTVIKHRVFLCYFHSYTIYFDHIHPIANFPFHLPMFLT